MRGRELSAGIHGKGSKLAILTLGVTSCIAYVFSVYRAYPLCLENRQVDPLATIHALFPFYYIAIFLFALACLLCSLSNINNKYVHVVLLTQFALMLWFTPYYLSGFVREPDGIWHVGVSRSIPEVMQGKSIDFSGYALQYPGSYILHYAILGITNISPKIYIGLMYPAILTFVIVLLWYTFLNRLFDRRTALLGTLIAMPGLHYVKLHPSPQTLGFALLLSSMIFLLTHKSREATALGITSFFSLIVTHPESPIVAFIFLAATLITGRIPKNTERQKTGIILVIGCSVWFSWNTFWATGVGNYLVDRIFSVLTFQFVKGYAIAQEYALKTPFVYPQIYVLNRVLYFLYMIITALFICQVFLLSLSLKRNIKAALTWTSQKLGYNGTIMVFSLPMFLVFTVGGALLGTQVLIERGLTILILVASVIIATQISRVFRWHCKEEIKIPKIKKNLGGYIAISFTVFFITATLTYPIVSYSIDAYLSYPPSEDIGLEFLSVKVPLDGRKIAMPFTEQLALYKPDLGPVVTVSLHFSTPADLNKSKPDVFVYRITGYYYAAMRLDVSFENNRFYNYSAFVAGRYNKVYSNPTFEVWVKPPKE